MIRTIAKLRAPWFGGKATIQFVKNFRRMKPAHRMSLLEQVMKQLREEYDIAKAHHRCEVVHEDARNADAATLRAQPVSPLPN